MDTSFNDCHWLYIVCSIIVLNCTPVFSRLLHWVAYWIPGGKEKEWTDCVADDLRLFGVTGDWKTAALDPGAWYNTVQEGGCRFMAAWAREEENASNQRQKKRDAEEADKVEVAPGVTVASLRRFRTALIGPTQGLTKRCRLCR